MILPGNRLRSGYRMWVKERGPEGLTLPILMDSVWQFLRGLDATRVEGFFSLMNFVSRAGKAQNDLISNLCKEYRVDFADCLMERAAMLYLKANKDLGRLQNIESKLGKDDFPPYLYNVLKYMLIRCNQKWIKDFYDPHKLPLKTDFISDNGTKGEAAVRSKGHSDFIIEEYMHTAQIREGARRLAGHLLEQWSVKKLNVLCHYWEILCETDTERLKHEGTANIHQLHKRLRTDLKGLVENEICSKDEMRVMLREYMPEICQKTPVLQTYKRTEPDDTET